MKEFPRSEFGKNVLTLITGTSVAQAIPIALSPVLTRLYTPEDFGTLYLFVSISAVFSSIATGRYELAIMLPLRDEEAINVAALATFIAIGLSLAILAPAIILNDEIVSLLGKEELGWWLYFVPLVVFMTGFFNVLNFLNTRKKYYEDIARSNIYKAFVLGCVQLVAGAIKLGVAGLISGQIISQAFANYRLGKNAVRNYSLSEVSVVRIKNLASRYINFPKYSMWSVLANALSHNLTNIIISLHFSVITLGFYSFAQKMLGMPVALIGNSVGQVYFQEATKEKAETGKCVATFKKTSRGLMLCSLLVFGPLYFVLPTIFEAIFGADWRTAGEYAQITLPFVAIQFISGALSNTNNIFEKQKLALAWQLGLLVLSLVTIFVSIQFGLNFSEFLQAFTAILFGYYLLLYIILLKVSEGKL